LSEIEKVKAEVNTIFEGLSNIVSRLGEIEETWDQNRQGAQIVGLETLAQEAFSKATQMKDKLGRWLWSRDAPELKAVLLKAEKKTLNVTIDGKAYTMKLGSSQEEPDAFLSFWPKK